MEPGESAATEDEEESDVESCKSDDTLDDYCLEWLFDETRIDHLPINQQLNFYKQRDLRKVKIYKIATQIWGVKSHRKRVIVAPPKIKNTATGTEIDHVSRTCQFNSDLKPQKPPPKLPTDAEMCAWEQQKKIEDYKKWVSDRKKFRHDLETMGLQEHWLSSKPDRTPLEQRVLRKMIKDRTPKASSLHPVSDQHVVLPDNPEPVEQVKQVERPSPLAIKIIEQFLTEKKLRLIDLFKIADKDKDWLISQDEFRQTVKMAKIPISETMLDNLIIALDKDMNNKLDYQELVKGMGLWKIEKRDSNRKVKTITKDGKKILITRKVKTSSSGPSHYKLSQMPGLESPDVHSHSLEAVRHSTGEGVEGCDRTVIIETHSSPITPVDQAQASQEPEVDQSKRNKDMLRMQKQRNKKNGNKRLKPVNTGSGSSVMGVGDRVIDDHCAPSTLGDTTADQVDRFRQLKLREFNEICAMCHINNVVLNKNLLEKVLLYPKDRPVKSMNRKIQQPSHPPPNFANEPLKRSTAPSTLINTKERRVTIKLDPCGRLMVEGNRGSYPSKRDVKPLLHKMHLSTGNAHIHRQVDCWMSFEEYDVLTRNLAQKFSHIHGKSDNNAFWPGHLLNKLRLYMPNSKPKSQTVFNSIKKEKKVYHGYDNNLRGWAQNDSGYVQMGIIDPYATQNIF